MLESSLTGSASWRCLCAHNGFSLLHHGLQLLKGVHTC